MNQSAALTADPLYSGPLHVQRHSRRATLSVALWIFILVASTLFSLFMAAYVMRMTGSDWSQFGMPWQLWLSSSLLLSGSLTLQLSTAVARAGRLAAARKLLVFGGICGFAFLTVQWWAWQVLLAMQVRTVGNPAGSFFYLLTALHGLHVIGGLVCWMLVMRFAARSDDAGELEWRIALCARYWHFLLLLWLALFAAFGGLSPEFVRTICGIQSA